MIKFTQQLTEFEKKNCERYNSIKVIGDAVFAQHKNGLYDMYLAAYEIRTVGVYDFKDIYCVCTNIEKFHHCGPNKVREGNVIYDKEVFLLKVKTEHNKGFWMPIFPNTFGFYLNSELAKAYFEDTPKIYFEGETEATVIEEFDYFCFEAYMFLIDKKHYLFYKTLGRGVILKEFKYVQALPSYKEFKVKDEKGEYFCDAHGGCISFGPVASIEEITKKEYPFLSEHYNGYFLRDESNNILGIYIAKDSEESAFKYSYKITLSEPAKEVKFLRRISIRDFPKDYNLPDEKDSLLPGGPAAEVWGIAYEDNRKELIIQTIGYRPRCMQYNLDYSNLIF